MNNYEELLKRDEMLKQLETEILYLENAKKEKDNGNNEALERYLDHYSTLPHELRCLVSWELAKRGASYGVVGHSISSLYGERVSLPISMGGWVRFDEQSGIWYDCVSFRINKECFINKKPLLYYLDEDNWPDVYDEFKMTCYIRQYSSGISNVRVEKRMCEGWSNEKKERRVILFELEPREIKNAETIYDKRNPNNESEDYMFVLPRAGEFYCVMGEIRDGEMIPLYKDDFCME